MQIFKLLHHLALIDILNVQYAYNIQRKYVLVFLTFSRPCNYTSLTVRMMLRECACLFIY